MVAGATRRSSAPAAVESTECCLAIGDDDAIETAGKTTSED
jgi:hypothetical protein